MQFFVYLYLLMFFFGIYFIIIFLSLYSRYRKELYNYPEPKKFPLVSIISPAYNEEKTIAGTLEALIRLEYPKGKKEIIVVNDGSTDNTVKIVRELMKKYKGIILLDKKNSGKADSLNKAVKIAKGELIVVVDADSYPAKDCLLKTIGYFEQDKKIAAVTTRVLVRNKKNFIERYQAFDYIVIAWSRKILDFINSVYVTNGPFSIYRKSLVKKVGGFDPKNLTEDIEITWHLLSKGYKTKMSYSAEVSTIVPDTLSQWVKQRVRWNLGGLQTIYKYKSYLLRGKSVFGYVVISYVSLSFFLALVGLLLFLRLVLLKGSFYLSSFPFIFQGYNPFEFIEFSFSFTFLMIFGLLFMILAFTFYGIAIKRADLKSKSILTILTYTFIYRILYVIPLVTALYKLVKGDINWYTK
ncbi:glycosyltransferase [Nanoarchaeota archaeon]